ncbi:MAG TPA: MBOAT family O-acyltransferase [Flavobacterium sp.]|jgi:D-alanyl-lipoteichoic acid acyltransferase DltB (MBOAT superfamily)
MIFNSIEFLFFVPVVFFLYWFFAKGNTARQNILLLIASYYFYANWDYRFLFLLILLTFIDYCIAIRIHKAGSNSMKKSWLWLSVGVNLSFLGIFKYFNFFSESFGELFDGFGLATNYVLLDVILPLGISFFTLRSISYVADVYKDKIVPERNFVNYALFLSFFPLLIAGPIERATHFLPQIQIKRVFKYDMAVDGLRQILWGLFMKVVIADNCGLIVNKVFDKPHEYTASSLIVGAIYFAFQIYGDFAGYSNIAIGTARLFGIDIQQNFANPYFSHNIAEFWRRWHISLSTWFRDYVYSQLTEKQSGLKRQIPVILLVFAAIGLWHGANWTFLLWGLLHAVYIITLLIFKVNVADNVVGENRMLPSLKELLQMLFTFGIITISWVIFRSESVADAASYLARMVNIMHFGVPKVDLKPFAFIIMLVAAEWVQRRKRHSLELSSMNNKILRWMIYTIVFLMILIFSSHSDTFIDYQYYALQQ